MVPRLTYSEQNPVYVLYSLLFLFKLCNFLNKKAILSGKLHYAYKHITFSLLGASAKLRKATITFIFTISVRPSVRPSVWPHGTTRLQMDVFLLNSTTEDFRKSIKKF